MGRHVRCLNTGNCIFFCLSSDLFIQVDTPAFSWFVFHAVLWCSFRIICESWKKVTYLDSPQKAERIECHCWTLRCPSRLTLLHHGPNGHISHFLDDYFKLWHNKISLFFKCVNATSCFVTSDDFRWTVWWYNGRFIRALWNLLTWNDVGSAEDFCWLVYCTGGFKSLFI